MAFDGSLEGFALTDILQIISVGKWSGLATVNAEGRVAKLVFKSGRLIHANDQGTGKLGKRLVEGGYISQDTLDEALVEQGAKRRHKPLATVLVQMGSVERELIESETERYIKDVFDAVLGWDNGQFTFKPTNVPGGLAVLSDGLSLEELLLGAAIALDDRNRTELEDDPEVEAELLSFLP